MAEIINAPLTKPEPNMRSAITPPASNSLFGADAVHQQRRQEHAAGFEEDLQRVEEAVHLVALFARSELRGEVDRKLLIENVVHADTEHKHHQRPEARHTQQRQRILQPQIFRFAERQARHGVRLQLAHLAEQQQEYQGGGGGQPEIDVRIDIEDKTGQKVALAQPSDPHMRARPNSKPLMRLTRSV